MPRQPSAVNAPLPPPVSGDGTRRAPIRRYHYIAVTVDADPEALADECNRRVGEGYTLVASIPVQRLGRTEIVLTFARRLRRRRGHPVAAATIVTAGGAPAMEGEPAPGETTDDDTDSEGSES